MKANYFIPLGPYVFKGWGTKTSTYNVSSEKSFCVITKNLNLHQYHKNNIKKISLSLSLSLFRTFSKLPHIAGGEENKKLAEYTRDRWREYGFDKVDMIQYDVLLSMPPKDKPNAVTMFDSRTNKVIVNVQGATKVRLRATMYLKTRVTKFKKGHWKSGN